MEVLLYDVHGNLPALEAVLQDTPDASLYILGGDYALFGGWPKETVERLRQLPDALWIRGNGERWLVDPDTEIMNPVALEALETVKEALGEQLVEDLAALPTSARRAGTVICHASPRSDIRSFMPEPKDDEAELLEGVTSKTLIFGHTHLPFERVTDSGIRLINPGSVGLPFDGDTRASYARIHEDGTIEHRRVTYDHRSSADQVREIPGWGETIARRIETAKP